MGKSVLVFVSHSSEDKEKYIEPIVSDLEECYINIWIDKRKIVPGDNLRKSIFRDGLDKADVALIFFTEKSLKSSWVDREIKHVLREESKKGNNFDLNKIISIFDSQKTYEEISNRYPELTDDLLHLMPYDYSKIQLGQLISAIWSKYLSLQGGDVETQKQLLAKEKEIFQKEKEISSLRTNIDKLKNKTNDITDEFSQLKDSGLLNDFIERQDRLLRHNAVHVDSVPNLANAVTFGLINLESSAAKISDKGKEFFKWLILNEDKNEESES